MKKEHIPTFLQRVFHIYPGEEKLTLLFALLSFIMSFSVSSAWKLADALFLVNLSANELPLAYSTTAGLVLVCALTMIAALSRFSPTSIFFTWLTFTGIFFGGISWIFLTKTVKTYYFWFLLKVCGQLFFIQLISSFWTFADQFFHFQAAKRLFTFFNCAIYIGTGCAGLLIQSQLTPAYIYFLLSLLLFVVLFISFYTSKHFTMLQEEEEIESKVQRKNAFFTLLSGITKSRFTMLLMIGNLLLFSLMQITEFNYFSIFETNFENSHSPHDAEIMLREFLGKLMTFIGVGNLIVGTFVYSRVLFRFGIVTLILITPLSYLFTYSVWPFDYSFFAPILGYIIVEGIYPVIEDNNFNLLLNAVPTTIKYKVRVLIESFSEPIGMLFASLLLTLANQNCVILGLLLSILSITIALMQRFTYFQAIFDNISAQALDIYKSSHEWLSFHIKTRNDEERLLSYLSSHNYTEQITAFQAILATENRSLIESAVRRIVYLEPKIQLAVFSLLEESTYKEERFVIEVVTELQKNSADLNVQAQADFYLAKCGLLNQDDARQLISSENSFQKAASILSLQTASSHQSFENIISSKNAANMLLEGLLNSSSTQDVALGVEILGYIDVENNMHLIMEHLKSPVVDIARAAAKALKSGFSEDIFVDIQPLFDEIRKNPDTEFRILCLQAIAKLAHTSLIRPLVLLCIVLSSSEIREVERIIRLLGLKSVPALVGCLRDTTLPLKSRRIAGKILGHISQAQLNVHLSSCIEPEIRRAYFYFYWGHTIDEKNNDLDMTLLKEGLLSSYETTIDFVISLLSHSKWLEEGEILASSVKSSKQKLRAHAIESLEAVCEKETFSMLLPLLMPSPIKDKLSFCARFIDTTFTIEQVLNKLEKFPSTLDAILASTWKRRLNFPGWKQALRRQLASNQEVFHHFAYELLDL